MLEGEFGLENISGMIFISIRCWSVGILYYFHVYKFRLLVKELFPEKALVKEFAQPTVQKRFHSGLL